MRSMASRGHLGGLSWATPQALRVLDAAGCDVVLVETVGVGQAEVEIAAAADTTLVLLAPGMGDSIQAAKAGILEIADIFVINKADRDGARQTARDINNMLSLGPPHGPQDWRPSIVPTVATRREGIEELTDALDAHHRWLADSGELDRRRLARAAGEIEQIALTTLRQRLGDLRSASAVHRLAELVVRGELDAYTAADNVVNEVTA